MASQPSSAFESVAGFKRNATTISSPDAQGASGDAPVRASYLERKTLAAKGIWGRVKEMPNGCWEWQGAIGHGDYGTITLAGSIARVHRLIAVIFNGPLQPKEFVCHSCDNPRCINPKHLCVGTAKNNSEDAVRSRERRTRQLLAEEVEGALRNCEERGSNLRQEARFLGVLTNHLTRAVRRLKESRGEPTKGLYRHNSMPLTE